MSDTTVLTIALGLVAVLFGLLMTVLGWLGNKVYSILVEMATSLNTIKAELHQRISGLDHRVTIIETRLDITGKQRKDAP